MCKFGIIKSLRKRFLKKHRNTTFNIIQFTSIQSFNIYITEVENADNFNPTAKNVNNTYYTQEPKDEEPEDES